ncbi:MAG: serine/threonine-protein kinase [Acidobacteriota bacterium]
MKQCPECKRAYDDTNSFCVFDGQRLIMTEEVDPFVGLLIDSKYHIDRRIAKGGSGNVYQATHIQLSAPVAVKIIHPRLASDSRAIERFRREALVTMKVRHTNAIAVMDFGITNNNVVYVVTELLEGVTLEQRLRQQGFLSLEDANTIVQQICAAIAVAHEHQIIHRDLKPENIFLHSDEDREVVKVVDFGIARFLGKVEDEEESVRLTQAGFVVGTPFYMSPEQCNGMEVDARSDIYSLGIIIYQMLTGRLPFEGSKAGIIVMKHKMEKPKPLYEMRPGIPAVINAVVMHALEKKPENRPQTVTELAHEMGAAIKAVTEQELQKVFLNATERDLEAAVLLACEPASGIGIMTEASRQLSAADLETTESPISKAIAISDSPPDGLGEPPLLDNLSLELHHSIHELSLIFQMIASHLENQNLPDENLFRDLKIGVDQLRGLLFAIQKTHYKI